MINVAINGFGRIGRAVARLLCTGSQDRGLRLVAVNDPMPVELAAHLFQHDSTYGALDVPVSALAGQLQVAGQTISYLRNSSLETFDWQGSEPHLLIEASGQYRHSDQLSPLISGSLKKILTASPIQGQLDATISYGVNHHQLNANMNLVSNASCTTNCLATLLQPLVHRWSIVSGTITSIHATTADQNLQDGPHEDYRLARSAIQSIVPTKTGATDALGLVMPQLANKFAGWVMRVPTLNVSALEITLQFSEMVSADEINATLVAASEQHLAGILSVTDEPLVSVDFLQHPASAILDVQMTKQSGNLIKMLSWYDNEWGFANRLLDTSCYWSQLQ